MSPDDILNYIENNLKEDFTLEDLSQKYHYSIRQLYYDFHNIMGMPIMAYVRKEGSTAPPWRSLWAGKCMTPLWIMVLILRPAFTRHSFNASDAHPANTAVTISFDSTKKYKQNCWQ